MNSCEFELVCTLGRAHVQLIVTHSLPSPFPCLYVLLYEHSPTFTPAYHTSSKNAKMKEVPTFAVLRQFRVAEQVTCHNSGKSLWLDLQLNSWHGMVEWQGLRLTLCRQQELKHSSAATWKREGIPKDHTLSLNISPLSMLVKAAIAQMWMKSSTQKSVDGGNS